MISTPQQAKSIFSVSLNHGSCLSAISRAQELCLVSLGPSEVPGMAWQGRNLLWSMEEHKDRAVFAFCRRIVSVLWVLWEYPCTQPQQWAPAAACLAPHTIPSRVSGVLHSCIPEQSRSVHAALQMGFGTVGDFCAPK